MNSISLGRFCYRQ